MATTPWQLTPRRKPLRIISTSDWHLGNSRVPAIAICNRLREVLFPRLSECDLLNIGGDVWHTLQTFSDEASAIVACLIDLLRLCHTHNVVVRVLLGTFTHDRDQSALFPIYHEKCHFTNDLRYISQVCLEHIEAVDVRILYLPDDLPYDSSDACLEAVVELMRARGWTWVDYVFGHGYFDHMLPDIPKKPKCTFRIEQFKPFVRRYVCMGHIHLHDLTGNVFYNNSFDRIAHGEEAPKGFMAVEDLGTTARLRFIENPHATRFITLDLSGEADKEAVGLRYLELLEQRFVRGELGYVRVIHPSVEIRQALRQLTTTRWPELAYSGETSRRSADAEDHARAHHRFDVNTYPTPTEATLPLMVAAFLERSGDTSLSLDRITQILSELTTAKS